MGGVLDLNRDGFIDYNLSTKQEFVYGHVLNVSYKSDANVGETPLEWEERNCYNGVHAEGTYSLSDDVNCLTAAYRGKNSFLSTQNITAVGDDNIAHANLTIYAEGWASSVIEAIQGTQFNLDLTFELSN